MKKLIAYLRVSTKQQGASGLGIEGQRTAVETYAKQTGAEVAFWYTEVESGKRSDRPELAKALSHARRIKAVLVVAKLDRLARNVAFLANLLESNVEFVACDNPAANKLTLHVLAAVAEAEATAISARTKAALQAYKDRGGKLGADLPQCRNLTHEARTKGAQAAGEAASRSANEAYSDLLPIVVRLRNDGITLQEIAATLNREGHTTRRGKPWNHVQVLRLLARANAMAI
jgi:DNA invertase Pin-like site-specific DNA recombinase